MVLFRAKSYEVLKYIYPHLVEDGEYTKDIIIEEIAGRMMNDPDSICVMVVFEGQEIIGYTIAWTLTNRNYVWLGQSWSSKNLSRNDAKKAVEAIEEWAEETHEIKEIRFETERNPDALERVWGFDIHSYIMQRKW